jgi:hypothetical protein
MFQSVARNVLLHLSASNSSPIFQFEMVAASLLKAVNFVPKLKPVRNDIVHLY